MTTEALPHIPGADHVARGSGLRGAIAAEWTKLWTVKSTRWLVCGSILLTPGVVPVIGITLKNNAVTDGTGQLYRAGDVAGDAVYYIVQLMVAALAMLVMTAEYSTGSIRSTLQWVPDRGRLLLAKAITVAAVTFVMGLAIGCTGAALAGLSLGDHGLLPLGRTVYQAGAIAVYLSLTSVITVFLATIVRSAPATLTTAFLVNMAVPSLMQASGILPLMWISQYTPSIAGRNTIMIDTGPYHPLIGLLVLLGWVVAGFFATRRVFAARDC